MREGEAKPQPKGPKDLHEVERALSVLGGRHPEHERARREDEENRRRRQAEQDATSAAFQRRVSLRRAMLGGIAIPVIGLFVFIAVFGRREMQRRARIDAVSLSFSKYGFIAIDTSLRGSTGALEATADPGCLLAVSTSDKPLTITRGGTTLSATAPALFCTCTSERITVTSPVSGNDGIALLRTDTSRVGGSRAFAFVTFPATSKITADEPCAEASLDSWIDAKNVPSLPVSDAWLAAKEHRSLKDAGFHVTAHAEGTVPLAVTELPAESCLLARSGLSDDALIVRPKGEQLPLAQGRGSVALCRKEPATLVVSHLGTGDLFLLVAPAARAGGLLGLREAAADAGVPLDKAQLARADRAWDAEQALIASGVPAGIIQTFNNVDVPSDPDARVVAASLELGTELFFDLPPSVHSACLPAMKDTKREELCVFSGAQKWRTPPASTNMPEVTGAFGVARSKLPFWLFSMQSMSHPLAVANLAKVLRVARLLVRQGFTPTTLEAMTERPNGVEVLGRTGEDAVVAIGVAPAPPFVYPLSEDAPWDLDGTPQIAMVKPLEKVTLVTTLKPLPPLALRRTVVFRRQTQVSP